jgi:hypothetical protein
MPDGKRGIAVPTNWEDSHRVGIPLTDEQWRDLGTLIGMKTPTGERPSYGRFIADTLLNHYSEELALIARQREELKAKLKGA